jgi:hypothetical protein
LRHFLTHTPIPINAEKISTIEPVDGSGVTICGGATEGDAVSLRNVLKLTVGRQETFRREASPL